MFRDRQDAAFQLIPCLQKYKDEDAVVLAIPRGGVPLGYEIAKHFHFPLGLLMTKKIGHPFNPEYAVGAVSMEDVVVNEYEDISEAYIEEKTKTLRENLSKRYKLFMGNKKPVSLENKIVIVIDDGMATGNTILCSVPMLRRKHVKKIVVAIPVAPPSAIRKIEDKADEVICLEITDRFNGVGAFYENFSQVEDEEVRELITKLMH